MAENRAALLALGVVLGHSKLVRVLGEHLDEPRARLIEPVRAPTTLRARHDWARHFSVSAALTVIADVAPSNAIGPLKEELDADGGSGFSFADLLADRAGTRLALLATRDEQTAHRVQELLAADCQLEELFPSPDGLWEGIPDAELRARYGGVGGLGYRKLSEDIERRLAESSAYGG